MPLLESHLKLATVIFGNERRAEAWCRFADIILDPDSYYTDEEMSNREAS